MEISGKIPPIKISAYMNNVQEKKKIDGSTDHDPKSVLKEDKVDISRTATEVKKARVQLDNVPDIREEKVAEIKNEINNGTYRIDGKKIAFNMIRESLIDEIV
ncbi:MAG: flagellar biosynthesis anti-sigma factor FlgM [Deltaproteobacteria bacterium]|nr:flagellar biosynthesis anti-sigma factor FlgM [Deltaproteobacteria bacterium]